MANIYDTKEKVQEYLRKNPMERGFYCNNKNTVRYLHTIGPMGKELFVGYVPKQAAINKLISKSKSMSVTAVNVRDSDIFDWFVNAEFLGATPEEAGLVRG
ncbi:hypothetical protein ESZ50_01265 [Weissella muntiaci]|uniref:Uncharacterized protein n=1 Tax=Weissella muntiaci TaxID=2508881 RepID=A0A6C2CA60_9LACO|nr:hypothetical protein [Weissella muntiaci]TYC50874.1 hypothetical protein ESZ50_01265 [Weissella muntiaci]